MSETPTSAGAASFGGFSVQRRLLASPARVFSAFVEPDRLEHWFVVDGFRTPADRMNVDARPGGRFEGVMVPEADGPELPFGFEYAELDPTSRVVLRFTDPDELVTVTLDLADDGSTDLDYEFVSTPPPSDLDASRRGVEDMLDRIEAGIERGVI
jgi:uncharacterized protein YndB with AHSA1/START domain